MNWYPEMCVDVENWQENNLEYFTNQMFEIKLGPPQKKIFI